MEETLFRFINVTNNRIKNISLTVSRNEKVVIFGTSGAGKSSLLSLFNRLQAPAEGEIYYKQNRIEIYNAMELRREVGMVFQEANLFPGSVYDNLKYGPELFGEFSRDAANKLMDFVQLPRIFLDKEANQLSGGEQQRVNLARTLANQPNVLLLDEPTSALDYKTSEQIEKLLLNLVREQKKTLVMITHNLSQARRMGKKGVFMDNGKLIEMGNMEELLAKPKTKELQKFIQENS